MRRPDMVVHGGVPDGGEGAEPTGLFRVDLTHRVEGRLHRRDQRNVRFRGLVALMDAPVKCS